MSTTPTLTKVQQRALEAVRVAREGESDRLAAAMHLTRARVQRALRLGVPARVLAEELGVTRARVYQMRDQAEAYEAHDPPGR